MLHNICISAVAMLGGVGGRCVTYYIWHTTDVRAEWPPFQRCQVYDWPPFFNKKYMNDPFFSGFLCEGPHFSDILVYAHISRSEIFRGCLFSWYSMN